MILECPEIIMWWIALTVASSHYLLFKIKLIGTSVWLILLSHNGYLWRACCRRSIMSRSLLFHQWVWQISHLKRWWAVRFQYSGSWIVLQDTCFSSPTRKGRKLPQSIMSEGRLRPDFMRSIAWTPIILISYFHYFLFWLLSSLRRLNITVPDMSALKWK